MISSAFSLLHPLLNIVFPKFCFHCRALGSYLCRSCSARLQYLKQEVCPYCEKESPYGLTHGTCRRLYGVDGLKSIFVYEEVFQSVLKAIKFRRVRGGMAALIDSVPEVFWQQLIETSAIFYVDAVVLPVPLHRKRYLERGFNQAEDFAGACAIMLQKNVVSFIARTRNTLPQSQLSSAAERYLNTHKAFDIKPNQKLPHKVIVVDDVWTTGATIREIAHILKYAGVERVYALTLARRQQVRRREQAPRDQASQQQRVEYVHDWS